MSAASSPADFSIWYQLSSTEQMAIQRLFTDGAIPCPKCKMEYARGHRDGLEERQAHIQGDDA